MRSSEGLDDLNGGGWGCIYSHQPLPSCCSNSANRGRSAPLVRTVRPCTSTAETQWLAVTAISTTILHLMHRQMSDKGSHGRSSRAPRTVREDAIIHLSDPVTFGFSVPHLSDGPRVVSDSACSSIGRSAVETHVLHWFCPRFI